MARHIIPAKVRLYKRFDVNSASGCWEWRGSLLNGYGRFYLGDKELMAHRASWILHHGTIPEGLHVLHKCDNRRCVNPKHLFLGTNEENVADRQAKGRQTKGEAHPCCKLTDEQVAIIRTLPGTHREIAKQFGVSHTTVGHIKRGDTRKL